MADVPVVFSPAGARAIEETVGIVRGDTRGRPDRWRAGGGFMPPSGRIRFKNESSEQVPTGGVMRITGADGTQGGFLKIAKPNTTFQRLYLVNVGDAINAGKFGEGSYLTSPDFNFEKNYVLYDTGNTPAFGESWGAKDGQWSIAKNRPGFIIQGGNTGTGSAARTIAIQEFTAAVFGKADAAITSGTSGTVRVYGGTQGSESDTGQTIATCWNEGADIADETDVKVRWLHGLPYIEQFSGGGSSTEIYRGVTDAAINKGASGTVSRYNAAGVDTTTNDTVTNLFANVAISKKVIYVKIESTFFMIAVECPMT